MSSFLNASSLLQEIHGRRIIGSVCEFSNKMTVLLEYIITVNQPIVRLWTMTSVTASLNLLELHGVNPTGKEIGRGTYGRV